jgi:hypothetical protein
MSAPKDLRKKTASKNWKMPISDEEMVASLDAMEVLEAVKARRLVKKARRENKSLVSLMVKEGVAGSAALDALVAITGVPKAPATMVTRIEEDPTGGDLESELFWRLGALPFFQKRGELWIAFADPDMALMGEAFGLPPHHPFLALEHVVNAGLARIFGRKRNLDTAMNVLTEQIVAPSGLFSDHQSDFLSDISNAWKAEPFLPASADVVEWSCEAPTPADAFDQPVTTLADEEEGILEGVAEDFDELPETRALSALKEKDQADDFYALPVTLVEGHPRRRPTRRMDIIFSEDWE